MNGDSVFIIPGFGSPAIEWTSGPIVDALHQLADDDVHVVRLPLAGVAGIGKAIRYTEAVIRQHHSSHRQLHLVGHSMGGLVATAIASKWESVKTVTTLGTPFKGSPWALTTLLPGSAGQMSRRSMFLATLGVPCRMLHCVAGTRDLLVRPSSALHEEADFTTVVPATHLSMLWSQTLADEVAKRIRPHTTTALAAA